MNKDKIEIEGRPVRVFVCGERAVVFVYTNTTLRASGIVTAETEHFIELKLDKRWGDKREWFPKSNAEPITSSILLK